jgi:hypothetical protein
LIGGGGGSGWAGEWSGGERLMTGVAFECDWWLAAVV